GVRAGGAPGRPDPPAALRPRPAPAVAPPAPRPGPPMVAGPSRPDLAIRAFPQVALSTDPPALMTRDLPPAATPIPLLRAAVARPASPIAGREMLTSPVWGKNPATAAKLPEPGPRPSASFTRPVESVAPMSVHQ